MYLIGAEHPFKADARRAIEDAIAAGEVLCTDAEVFQEMLHRYRAIDRPDAIDAGFAALLGIVDVTYSIELSDVERARRLLRSAERPLAIVGGDPCSSAAGRAVAAWSYPRGPPLAAA